MQNNWSMLILLIVISQVNDLKVLLREVQNLVIGKKIFLLSSRRLEERKKRYFELVIEGEGGK